MEQRKGSLLFKEASLTVFCLYLAYCQNGFHKKKATQELYVFLSLVFQTKLKKEKMGEKGGTLLLLYKNCLKCAILSTVYWKNG